MQWVSLGTFEALKEKGSLAAHGVVAFYHEDKLRVVDNRCPHMGFPLSKGTVSKGILTCHWHSWQFDLESGGCLTPLEADVAVYPCRVENGEVQANLKGLDKSTLVAASQKRLDCALQVASTLEASKASYRLLKEGQDLKHTVRSAAELGMRFQSQFSAGMVSLTALTRVLQDSSIPFSLEEKVLGLMQGVSMVAGEVQGTSPRRFRPALPAGEPAQARLKEWFKGFVEDRESFAAERVFRTAAASSAALTAGVGAKPEFLAELLLSTATDHVFIGTGHILDFVNKAFELLDIVGWDLAPDLLTSLLSDISTSTRHEEEMAWKHPVDLVKQIAAAEAQIVGLPLQGGPAKAFDAWEWGEFLNASEPEEGLAFIVDKFKQGYGLEAVAKGLAAGSILRMHRFHTRNEFYDWDSLHHLFTHANAFWRLSRRFPSPELARNAFHLYGYLYLTRFLNLPRAPLPEEGAPSADKAALAGIGQAIGSRDIEGSAALVHRLLAQGTAPADVKKALALAAWREDHGFHSWQQLEAAFSLHELLGADPHAGRPLSSLARWLAAHSPTPGSMRQTVDNAIRLERGDKLYED
jgi:nitrite reductase/ring-hydroxylating ferredoxin subunit